MELDLADVLSSMAVGVFVTDATGTLIAANQPALQIAGVKTLEELRTKPRPYAFPDVRNEDGTPIPPDHSPFTRALAGEEVIHVIEVIDHVNRGRMVLRTRTTPIRNPAGAIVGAVKVVIDVTAEHELAGVRDEFIRQAAHELKSPIALIKANAEALVAAEPAVPERFGALIRGVERMDGLINSLLDLADLQGGMFCMLKMPVAMERVVVGALARLTAAARRRIHVTAKHVLVRCDEARMRRAIYALVDNAVKYSPPDSPVEIEVTHEDGMARVAVRDHGYGIPADKQPRIFEKYFRAYAGTERDAGGLGVGLYVAREIVLQHDGRIWFESTENRGSVFFVEMPVDIEAT